MSDASNPAAIPSAAGSAAPEAVGGLPVPSTVQQDDTFIGEFAVMDLTPLKDKLYMVAIGAGTKGKGKFLCSSVHGPYDFLEMVQEVGMMWQEYQHHARIIILEKDVKKRVRYLDDNTADYIEAQWENIITESVLEGVSIEEKQYTHVAGFQDVTIDAESNPQLAEKRTLAKDDEEDNV